MLSPQLFNILYVDYIVRRAMDEWQREIFIAGRKNNLRLADGTSLIASTEEGLVTIWN